MQRADLECPPLSLLAGRILPPPHADAASSQCERHGQSLMNILRLLYTPGITGGPTNAPRSALHRRSHIARKHSLGGGPPVTANTSEIEKRLWDSADELRCRQLIPRDAWDANSTIFSQLVREYGIWLGVLSDGTASDFRFQVARSSSSRLASPGTWWDHDANCSSLRRTWLNSTSIPGSRTNLRYKSTG